jgi:hypothetical protein
VGSELGAAFLKGKAMMAFARLSAATGKRLYTRRGSWNFALIFFVQALCALAGCTFYG